MNPKRSLRPKKKVDIAKERLKKIDLLHCDIESRIMMTDDNEELLLMGSLFLAISKNIFVAIHGPKKTKMIINQFVKNIPEK